MTNFPTFFTCSDPISTRASIILAQSDFFISEAVASASATPPFDKAEPPAFPFAFIVFIDFMAFIDFIAAMD